MAQRIVIPRMGLTMQEGIVAKWLCRDGDTVAPGDEIYELEYDKSTATVQAKKAGVVKLLAEEGATVALGETVADAYHFTRRYIQQGIAGFHVEDERNPKHSKHVNGLWSIADQQARIDAAARARRDMGQDFIIIARCDELYTSEMGGGGTGSMEEAFRRGHAYVEAGADALFYPPRPDWVPELLKEFATL